MRTLFRAPTATILVAAVITLTPASSLAGAKVALYVSPRIANEPATLMIRATVEPHADNRALHVEIESGGYRRSSVIQLEGVEAPRITTTTYPAVPGGIYEVRTTVIGPGGKPRATAAQEIRVLSKFDG